MYWHLQKNGALVNIVDTITLAQLIGYSGNTGYTAYSHLHLQVQNSIGQMVATLFLNIEGVK